ncbi:MAG: chromate transporter, chromate ion transporter family [Verrucomicrobia bacterium]|nr:chromate transporter, chromate ion transporter family [Verrucomicrobiota bacterium]
MFLKLGLTSFGGPVAHLGYFHEEIVRRRHWVDEEEYADLVALCQFLPGPASSQVVFALGMKRGGLPGALFASFCFTLPSAVLMILFAYGLAHFASSSANGWLHGLKVAAVAVVAQAVWTMGRKLCPDALRLGLGVAATASTLLFPSAGSQVAAIGVGAAVGWMFYRRKISPRAEPKTETRPRSHFWAAAALLTFAVLLIALPIAATMSGQKNLRVLDSFYRAGALVFGGGHVVLPLLRAELVPPGWISDDAFLAGYGAAQALPGPLFTFAAYLGTVICGGDHPWVGGVAAVLAIFLPAWLLIGGALPFWHSLRGKAWAQAGLRGANAAVVGVLLAALYHPLWQESVASGRDILAVVAALSLLQFRRVPPWLVVMLAAVAGQWVL